jgi:riboflavin biosynthesis pyrimidine reductase
MRIVTDYPQVEFLDTNDAEALAVWWDTLGESWIRTNLVTDSIGHVVGATGSSSDLTGGSDRAVLTALRAIADVVVLGGETVRREPDSVPRGKPVIIVSKSANVPIEVIHRARAGITVLHSPDANAPEATNGIAIARLTGAAIVKAARSLGYKRILCEGGPTLIAALLKANLVDEWCQTVSPKVGAFGSPMLVEPAGTTVSIAHDDDGFRFLRRQLNGAPRG